MTEEEEVERYIRDTVQNEIAAVGGVGNFPEPPDKDNLLKFMRGVIDEDVPRKMIKTANFRDEEVGKPRIPVLTYAMLANYGDAEGYDLVRDYLNAKAGIIATVSLGRRAKALDTLFTVRRETKNIGTPRVTNKKSLFGETTTKEGMEP
jgi:hypothetical protein